MKKLWYRFLFWLTGTKVYLWSMKHVIPFIRLSLYYSLPDNKKYKQWGALERDGYKKLKKGHIVFTYDSKKLTSKIIGNATVDVGGEKPYFVPSHVALCVEVNRDSSFEIAEMTHLDYTKSTWEDVIRESTRVVIAECTDFDQEYIDNVLIPKALTYSNRKYDDRFQMGDDTLACSELVYFADDERRLKVDLQPIIGDKPYISPVGLILGENVKIVWDSNEV